MVEKALGHVPVVMAPPSRYSPRFAATPFNSQFQSSALLHSRSQNLLTPRKASSLTCSSVPPKSISLQRPGSCVVPVSLASSSSCMPRSRSQCSVSQLPSTVPRAREKRPIVTSRSPSPARIVGQQGPNRRQLSPRQQRDSSPLAPAHGTPTSTMSASSSLAALVTRQAGRPLVNVSSWSALTAAASSLPSAPRLKQEETSSPGGSSTTSGQTHLLLTSPRPSLMAGNCTQEGNVHAMFANAETVLADWLSEKSRHIVQGALLSIQNLNCGSPTNWSAEVVRRFGVAVLTAHGIDPPNWELSTWLDIHATVIWLPCEIERPVKLQQAEKLARRIFEHLRGQANAQTEVASFSRRRRSIASTTPRPRELISHSTSSEIAPAVVPAVEVSGTCATTNNAGGSIPMRPGPLRRAVAHSTIENHFPGIDGNFTRRKNSSEVPISAASSQAYGVLQTIGNSSLATTSEKGISHAPAGLTQNGASLLSSSSASPTRCSLKFSPAVISDSSFKEGHHSLGTSSQQEKRNEVEDIHSDGTKTDEQLLEELARLRDTLARERADNRDAWQSLGSFVDGLFASTEGFKSITATGGQNANDVVGDPSTLLKEKLILSIANVSKGANGYVEQTQNSFRDEKSYEDANDELSLPSFSEEPSAVLKAIGNDGGPLHSPLKTNPSCVSPSLMSSPPLSFSEDWASVVLGATPLSPVHCDDAESPQRQRVNCSGFGISYEAHDKKLAAARATLSQLDRSLAPSSPGSTAANDAQNVLYHQKCATLPQNEIQHLQEEIRRRDLEVQQLQEALSKTRGILLGTSEATTPCEERSDQ